MLRTARQRAGAGLSLAGHGSVGLALDQRALRRYDQPDRGLGL
jgi:hypothetical protein